MKKKIISILMLSWPLLSFSQIVTTKPNSYWRRADSLFKAKDYNNAALYYSMAIRYQPDQDSKWARWVTAVSWAKANKPDSVFYNLEFIAASKTFTITDFYDIDDILSDDHFLPLQNDPRFYSLKEKMINHYKELGSYLSARIGKGHRINLTYDIYEAAEVWALANEPDTALHLLEKIIKTDNNVFINYPLLKKDSYFLGLHNDQRWQSLLETVKNNYKWKETKHTFTGPDIPMIATILPESQFLKSDGRGSYRNGIDKVISKDVHGYSLDISGNEVWYKSGDRNELSPRFIMLDLNSPIKGSGAKRKGIIRDHKLEFHVLYKMDTSVSPKVVYNFREIPIGSTIHSDRTEIDFYINDHLYTLTMGWWGFGYNDEVIAHTGHLNGNGTTAVLVTRESETEYTIEAPQGSIGRLWDTENMTKPLDLGLYETGFKIHLQKQDK